MAITHGAPVRDAVCNTVVDLIDVGATNPSGRLVFRIAAGTAAATLPMSATAFGNASGGSATANAITSDTNAAGGNPVTNFIITDKNNATIIAGSVGTSASDINLSSVNIGAGDTVSVSSLTYTAMP
jgi:hypothetical protein